MTNENKKSRSVTSIFIGVGLIILALYVLFNYPKSDIPEGVPKNYYDRIDILDEAKAEFYLLSDQIHFRDDLYPTRVSHIDDIPLSRGSRYQFIIIDSNYMVDKGHDYLESLQTLYNDYCYYVFIVNYKDSGSTEFDSMLDEFTRDSNFITLTFTTCDGIYYQGYNSTGFPSYNHLMYGILDAAARIIEESEIQ